MALDLGCKLVAFCRRLAHHRHLDVAAVATVLVWAAL